MEPPSDERSIKFDELEPGKKSICLRCSYGRGLQMEPPRRKKVLRCSHIYGSGNVINVKQKVKIYKLQQTYVC